MFELHMAVGRQAAVIVRHLFEGNAPTARLMAEAFVWTGKDGPVEALRVSGPVPDVPVDMPGLIHAERDRTGVQPYQMVRGEVETGILLAAMQFANGAADAALLPKLKGGDDLPLPLFQTREEDWATRHIVPPTALIRLSASCRPLVESIGKNSRSTDARQLAAWSLKVCEGIERGSVE
jgi:hypothetical protein